MVYSFGDSVIMVKNNNLYLRVNNNDKCIKRQIGYYQEGLEIKHYGRFFALRDGNRIYISDDLYHWKLIFENSGSTGIRESMCFVTNKENVELIFSEYTINPEQRCYIYSYNCINNRLDTLQRFFSLNEGVKSQMKPYARHTHVLMKDPYTGYIFIGNGDDNGGGAAIYYSKDNCRSLIKIGSNCQKYRTLSFIFTKESIWWNMDATQEYQYMVKLNREYLPKYSVISSNIICFPLVNSAHWLSDKLSIKNDTMFIMSSNNEGHFIDNESRIYGIKFLNDKPVFYELLHFTAVDKFHQYYPMGTMNNKVLLMDKITHKTSFYEIVADE